MAARRGPFGATREDVGFVSCSTSFTPAIKEVEAKAENMTVDIAVADRLAS